MLRQRRRDVMQPHTEVGWTCPLDFGAKTGSVNVRMFAAGVSNLLTDSATDMLRFAAKRTFQASGKADRMLYRQKKLAQVLPALSESLMSRLGHCLPQPHGAIPFCSSASTGQLF